MGKVYSFFLCVGVMAITTFSETFIKPDNPHIQYFGRIDCTASDRVVFDWPGVFIEAIFQGTSCRAVFEGVNYFDAFIDGVLRKTFKTGSKKSTVEIAKGLTDRNHRLRIVKRSESVQSPTSFFGLLLNNDKTLIAPPKASRRKIEFIGDSYTVGFANEYLRRECRAGKEDSIILAATNTDKAFGPLVARAFGAQYHIIAVSGKGLIRNYNGIDKGNELPALYDRTLVSSINSRSSSQWDFSQWKADVVVIGIGVNDFQADPPYADSAKFDVAYIALINRLRKQYSGVKIICCATKVWPTDALIPHIKSIVAQQHAAGFKDVRYFEYTSENGALYGHPHIYDHQTIAKGLIPIVAEVAGWRRTDMVRGK